MSTTGAELGELVTRISRRLRLEARGQGLAPHQFRALRIIAQEPVRPARLAEALAITPRAVTDVVDALEAAGLVAVDADPDDRRAKLVSATDLGHERLAEVRRRRDAASNEIFGVLDDAERDTLGALLARVVADGGATQ